MKFYIYFIPLLFLSCKESNSTEQKDEKKLTYQTKEGLDKETYNNPVKESNTKFLNEADFCEQVDVILKVKESENERIIEFEDIKLITPFEQDNANLFWKDSKAYATNYSYGHLEYEFNEKEKGFMLFKCNENYSLLFLEVHTEEFPTFQKIKLDNIKKKVSVLGDFTISLKNFEKIYKTKQKEIQFFITNIDNHQTLVSKNDKGEMLGVYNKKI